MKLNKIDIASVKAVEDYGFKPYLVRTQIFSDFKFGANLVPYFIICCIIKK